eukprot:m.30085 g.30085  ORF g.30085 m.30085 type:complete len:329 (-) comp9243_c0_seq1:1011-1997(-)
MHRFARCVSSTARSKLWCDQHRAQQRLLHTAVPFCQATAETATIDQPAWSSSGHLQAVSFSGSGWLVVYHLGVLHALQRHGLVCKQSTVFAGASGGSIAAVIGALGRDAKDLFRIYSDMACTSSTTRSYMRQGLERDLREFFPPALQVTDQDVATLNEQKHLLLAVTPLHRLFRFHRRRPVLVDQFGSPEDLLDTLIASCYIPFYLGSQPFAEAGGKRLVDGGFIDLIPHRDSRLNGAVNVSAMPFHAILQRIPFFASSLTRAFDRITNIKRIDIAPHLDPATREEDTWAMARYMFIPPPQRVGEAFFEQGVRSAEWYLSTLQPASHV